MIGILGGTFDPVHYGHLRPAQHATRALGLSALHVVPTGASPHGKTPTAAPADRLEMVRLACGEIPGFVADDREIRRAGLSYTVDTLRSVREEIGATTPLCLLMGTDAFLTFETWNRWTEIPLLAHIVVLQRPGTPVAPIATGWALPRLSASVIELTEQAAGRLLFQPVPPQAISSTQVRAALVAGADVSTLLPAPVWQFIRNHHLYTMKGD